MRPTPAASGLRATPRALARARPRTFSMGPERPAGLRSRGALPSPCRWRSGLSRGVEGPEAQLRQRRTRARRGGARPQIGGCSSTWSRWRRGHTTLPPFSAHIWHVPACRFLPVLHVRERHSSNFLLAQVRKHSFIKG